MSTNDWTELTRLWQSDVPAAAPALEVIAKQQRRAWVWRPFAIFEVVVTIVGVAASIANAVYHATGKRIRDLPITLDKLLA